MTLSEKYRPLVHFSPRRGWMNDPNGLIVVDGTYHLFFQHDPNSIEHGPMHWGHATSRDLVNWHEQPVALAPDPHGACWSGSAVETTDGEIKLFYTAHRRTGDGAEHQTQCLVHADRALTQFVSEPGNPIVDNPGLAVFRDPKVIWHEPSRRWIMLVTLGRSIGFYGSRDLVSWAFLDRFGDAEDPHGEGPWECPDMVQLAGPDGEPHWVLIVGDVGPVHGGGPGTRYFVGRFDGRHFVSANPADIGLWLDRGRDCYAAQTFFGRRRQAPLLIAWASNWRYAKVTPTEAFRGAMTLPRCLAIKETEAGLRLTQSLPPGVRAALPEIAPSASASTPGTFRMRFDLVPGAGLRLFGPGIPQLHRSQDGRRLRVRRDEAWAAEAPDFRSDYVIDVPEGPVTGEVYVDQGIVEVSLFDGLVWITQVHYPEDPKGAAYVTQHPVT